MRRLILLLLLLLAAAGYYYYPQFTLGRIVDAIDRGDSTVVDALVDWPKVRESLKADMMGKVAPSLIQDKDGKGGGLAALGAVFGSAMTDRVIEGLVNSQALIESYKKLGGDRAALSSHLQDRGFISPTQYAVRFRQKDAGVDLVMALQGAEWRVVRVTAPSGVASGLLQSLRTLFDSKLDAANSFTQEQRDKLRDVMDGKSGR